MNNLVENRVVNCYKMVDLAVQHLGDSTEDAINKYSIEFYEKIDVIDRGTITLEEFKNKVREYTILKPPPPVLKELYIDPWLEPIWRKNE